MTEEQLREKITGIIAGDGVYYYEVEEAAKYTVDGMEARQLSQIIELTSLFTHQLELAKIEAKIEELELHIEHGYMSVGNVVTPSVHGIDMTQIEVSNRISELTKQKEEIENEPIYN